MRGGFVVMATAFGVLVGAAGKAGAAGAADGPEGPAAYRMAPGAIVVQGAENSADRGPELRAGASTYTDGIKPKETKYYTVELDGQSSAYVSAVAVPRPGSAMGLRDGIDVSLQAPDGTQCGTVRHRSFLSAGGAYPVADYAERVVKPGAACAAPGSYRFVVERGDALGGDASAVPIELKYVAEPPQRTESTDTLSAPGAWSSQAPSKPPQGAAEGVTGGTGFNDAAELRPGMWRDELRPGDTRFYRVSVDAGEQLFADAEFGGADGGGPMVIGGVRLGLNNAARGFVMNKTTGYQGKPATVALATPPAAYGGGGGGEAVRGMRFAGWYYLQVSLSPKVRQGSHGGGVPVTLRVDVAGARKADQGTGRPQGNGGGHPGGGGGVGGELVASAGTGPRNERLRTIGYVGIGTGTTLLLGLGVWTFLARRR
ncbi:hypothetical protein [Streptomyces sp. UNOB3_S3]|uniref:hypothetical protein n=1 Tax=Streptomyces sp. UNOB3_S3 TaxID=2871682 RepID=UPI001E37FEB2|nr:hypothetical protein [Streptomyces sp. UNOB3_S3]MCC3774454.1 hypothetical protein [Streptomyces sp. UNOB3_S3]